MIIQNLATVQLLEWQSRSCLFRHVIANSNIDTICEKDKIVIYRWCIALKPDALVEMSTVISCIKASYHQECYIFLLINYSLFKQTNVN